MDANRVQSENILCSMKNEKNLEMAYPWAF